MKTRLMLERLMRLFNIVVCMMLMVPADAIWWAVGSQLLMDPDKVCLRLRQVTGRRSRICRSQPEVIDQVHRGVVLATTECQYQFRNRRWNCTTDRKSLERIMMQDLRETAFVNAITSAGLAHAITSGCSRGDITKCSCDKPGDDVLGSVRTAQRNWLWGGCGDNVKYGYEKSREFLEALYRGKPDFKTLIILRNNEVGRLAIRKHMRYSCKCHGLTGSCTIKTCWRLMPPFGEVGDRLKDRFDKAIKVVPGSNEKGLATTVEGLRVRGNLVYAEDSPNFCEPNLQQGSLGSHGRRCIQEGDDWLESGGCDLMCCGRGHTTMQLNTTVNCRCRFVWCCEITCDECSHTETQHFCR